MFYLAQRECAECWSQHSKTLFLYEFAALAYVKNSKTAIKTINKDSNDDDLGTDRFMQ